MGTRQQRRALERERLKLTVRRIFAHRGGDLLGSISLWMPRGERPGTVEDPFNHGPIIIHSVDDGVLRFSYLNAVIGKKSFFGERYYDHDSGMIPNVTITVKEFLAGYVSVGVATLEEVEGTPTFRKDMDK